MQYQVEQHGDERKYMQLFYHMRREVLEGILPVGSKLPSKRTLSAELNISLVTVERAYELLCDEGYIESRPRSGFYVCFGGEASPLSLPRRASLEDMQAGESAPEDFPFSLMAKTMRHVLSEYGRKLLVKSPNRGCEELRLAIAAWLHRSRKLNITPEQIIIGSGSEYLYGVVVQLLGRESPFALEDPCYEKIRRTYEVNGASCQMLKMGKDGIESAALASCSARVLHVTPFHSYPSGVTATASKRREYAAWARRSGAFIVEDDYDAEFAASTPQVETIHSLCPERVIYLNTFSKLLAPSMRTGFMVLPPSLLEEYQQKLGFISCTVPVFDQLVLASFLNEGHLERYVNRQKRRMRQREKQPSR